METVIEQPIDVEDVKMSSFNHAELQSHLAFLFKLSYRNQYSILTEPDFDFASGKTAPTLLSCQNVRQIG